MPRQPWRAGEGEDRSLCWDGSEPWVREPKAKVFLWRLTVGNEEPSRKGCGCVTAETPAALHGFRAFKNVHSHGVWSLNASCS